MKLSEDSTPLTDSLSMRRLSQEEMETLETHPDILTPTDVHSNTIPEAKRMAKNVDMLLFDHSATLCAQAIK